MKSIKLFTVIIAATMMFAACSKDDSYSESDFNSDGSPKVGNVTLPWGFYSVVENNSDGPGVNTQEGFFFYNEKSFEVWKQYGMTDDYIQNTLVRKHEYGYIYVNVTSLTVFEIYKWMSEPGRFVMSGKIINDSRFKDIYYSLKFDVTSAGKDMYRLTFVGESSPIFMYGDSFVVKYLADIEYYL